MLCLYNIFLLIFLNPHLWSKMSDKQSENGRERFSSFSIFSFRLGQARPEPEVGLAWSCDLARTRGHHESNTEITLHYSAPLHFTPLLAHKSLPSVPPCLGWPQSRAGGNICRLIWGNCQLGVAAANMSTRGCRQ